MKIVQSGALNGRSVLPAIAGLADLFLPLQHHPPQKSKADGVLNRVQQPAVHKPGNTEFFADEPTMISMVVST